MDIFRDREPPMPCFLKNVDGKVEERSKRATLCICGPRKAYDRVPREELWYCMSKSGMTEKYARLLQDMYDGSKTVMSCAVGTTKSFKVKVGLHQRSTLNPFLFAVIMDRLTEEVRRKPAWTMLFADDIVICEKIREEVERRLECWRYALERRGIKVSRSKNNYLRVNGGNDKETVKLKDTKVPRVKKFKYLGSMVQESGSCEREIKKKVQAGWNGWRKVSGVICDRKLLARVKGKVYSSVVKQQWCMDLSYKETNRRDGSSREKNVEVCYGIDEKR